jgi:hypothetical protein
MTQLTPEQRAEVDRRRAAGLRSTTIEPTPEQRAEIRKMIEIEEAGIPANIAYMRALDAARAEPGFSGDLRRAILATKKPPQTVAEEAGVDPGLVDRFCCAEACLPNEAIDRLVQHLHLQLVQAIR